MEFVFRSIFTLRLVFSVSSFLLKVLGSYSVFSASLFASTGLLILTSSALVLNTQHNQAWAQAVQTYLGEVNTYQASLEEQQLNKWQQLLAVQPTHRDALLNATKLACNLRLTQLCTVYGAQLLQVDPNHPEVLAVLQNHPNQLSPTN